MHERSISKGMCSGLHGLFKFLEISDNTLENVQDNRRSYNGRLLGNEMAPVQYLDLE